MGKALIVAAAAALTLAGCVNSRSPVIEYRPVEVLKPTPVPCVDAADRRPQPAPLSDEALPNTLKQLVGTLLQKIDEWVEWGGLATKQLDACTKEATGHAG